MKYTSFHEARFRSSVDKALQQVQTILEHSRNPRLAAEEPHQYDDKYALVECLTNMAVASETNALERLGLAPEQLQTVCEWVHNDKKSVTLRFQAEDACEFLKEQLVDVIPHGERTVESTTITTTGSGGSGGSGGFLGMGGTSTKTETTKVKVRVMEYHWKVTVTYKLLVFAGSDPDDETKSLELQSRSASEVIMTSGTPHSSHRSSSLPPTPIAESTVHPPNDVNMTWFFQQISPTEQSCDFVIDRNATDEKGVAVCKTPRRNPQVEAALECQERWAHWLRRTHAYFVQRVEAEILGQDQPVNPPLPEPIPLFAPGALCTLVGLQKEPTFNGNQVRILEYDSERALYRVEAVDPDNSGLPPTLVIKAPNLQSDEYAGAAGGGPALSTLTADNIFCPVLPLMEDSSVLSTADVADFLSEQNRGIDEGTENLGRLYPPRQLMKLVSTAEATIVLMSQHLLDLSVQYHDSVDYVEEMLKQQLLQAIGRNITSKDFDQFTSFHNQRLFGPMYAPIPFSYAVRRPDHYPDGVLSIEGSHRNEPVETMVRTISGSTAPSIHLPINAATNVEIKGDRHLHGWLLNRFSSRPRPQYNLIARARQFSSFLVIVGTMSGPEKFTPKDAIILQNKDEVLIPLLTNILPTAKEFKDAIASLSPEQQSFAKTFRAMQLETSVFAVCIVQLKPQLEKLLELPPDSLTKEIQLTQDLMSLFVDYQIPSDLLSFDGPADASTADKVAAVKEYVSNVLKVIAAAKEKQLAEAAQKTDMAAEMYAMDHPAVTSAAAPGSMAPPPTMYSMAPPPMASMAPPSPYQMAPPPPNVAMAAMQLGGSFPVMEDSVAESSDASRSRGGQAVARRAYKVAQMTPAVPKAMKAVQVQDSMQVSIQSVQPGQVQQTKGSGDLSATSGEDFTVLPKILDAKIEKFDTSNALRTTILKAGSTWTRNRQENLLTPMKTSTLTASDTNAETKKAFDLLDAISRSGTLPISCAELHVVVALSHCFDNDLMGTIVQDNINPIEKVERSSLLLASTIHGEPAQSLIGDVENRERLMGSFPLLFDSGADSG